MARDFVPRRAQGFALIVALILLLVMTMVAVVAMRSTTLDLKMTTNTALSRRAFQASEGIRTMVGPLLEASAFWQGWPVSLGGTLPDGLFPPNIDANIALVDPGVIPSNGEFTLAELEDPSDPRHDTPDIEFHADLNGNGIVDAEDVRADVWLTKTGFDPDRPLQKGSATQSYGTYVIYEIRSRGRSAGNAEVRTTADFRVLAR
jgi:hypothetical protein